MILSSASRHGSPDLQPSWPDSVTIKSAGINRFAAYTERPESQAVSLSLEALGALNSRSGHFQAK